MQKRNGYYVSVCTTVAEQHFTVGLHGLKLLFPDNFYTPLLSCILLESNESPL